MVLASVTLDIGLHEVCVQVGGRAGGRAGGRTLRHNQINFYRMGSLPNFLTHGAPLACFARESSAIILMMMMKMMMLKILILIMMVMTKIMLMLA